MQSYITLYVHLVWSTKYRLPMINPTIEPQLYAFLAAEAQRQGCIVNAINGVSDHVHMLVSIPATLSVADLAKQLKGASAHYVNRSLFSASALRWQRGYAAFSVSRWEVDKITQYVDRQKLHHTQKTLVPAYELLPDDSC